MKDEIKRGREKIIINAGNSTDSESSPPNQIRLGDIVVTSSSESISELITALGEITKNEIVMEYLKNWRRIVPYAD